MNGLRDDSMKFGICVCAAVMLAAAGVARAQVYTEVGDAGELAGGQSTGGGTLTAIEGSLSAGSNDADMYSIRVDDWSLFSASTLDISGLTSPYATDTALFLFDATGHGIAFTDDTATDTLSLFAAGDPVYAGRTNGEVVWLAVSGYDYDAESGGNQIWADSPYDAIRAPDGPGAAGAVDGWGGTSYTDGTYRVTLTGVSAVPTPGPFALLGLTGLCAARRRRRAHA